MKTLLQLFTWWNGSTWNTRFHIWRTSTLVGHDEFGNAYYESRDGKRYVQYEGEAEASKIPSGWHGWMHYRTDVPPAREDYEPKDWPKPHQQNLTGTPGAYYPPGAMQNPQSRPEVTGDYDAWSP